MNNNSPCLFDFATSELSQDAFIAWLVKWSDDSFSGSVHDFGREFLSRMLSFAGVKDFCMNHLKIEVFRQYYHIDVFCEINDNKIALIIEDKVNATQHDNQLERYKKAIEQQKKYEQIVCIYLKTGDQSNYDSEKNAGFTVVNRKNLLEWFNSEVCKRACHDNKIVDDFVRHIQGIEDLVNGYLTEPLDKWDWNAWKGFYMALQAELSDANWDYVANPAGGFMGLWWGWRKDGDGYAYLQLEEAKACFKFEVSDAAKERKSDIKYDWNQRILETYNTMREQSRFNVEVVRPSVLRVGQWMTVAILKDDYRVADSNGKLNMGATVENLREMEAILEKTCNDQSN